MTWCSERISVPLVVVESQPQGLQLPDRYPIVFSFSMYAWGGGEMLLGGEAALTAWEIGETLSGGVRGVPIAAWSPIPAPFSSARL